jgi:hypothetical protein
MENMPVRNCVSILSSKCSVYMYVNGKMISIETVPGMGCRAIEKKI